MVDFGSEEWAAEAAELWPLLPPAPGLSGTVGFGVLIAPRKEVAFHWRYVDGSVVGGGTGAAPASDAGDWVSFTLSRADAGEVLSGGVAPSVAFMRGRLKTAGDNGMVLAFLASTEEDGFADWLRRLSTLAAV
jgi:hypothetical protein